MRYCAAGCRSADRSNSGITTRQPKVLYADRRADENALLVTVDAVAPPRVVDETLTVR